MKHFFVILGLLFSMLLSVPIAHAMESEEYWSYIFHLEWKNGVLAKNSDEKFFYDLSPVLYTEVTTAGGYYADVISGKGVALARVWFSEPTTILASRNKKVLDLHAPFFANADHVSLYNKDGLLLFSESLAGSSFCNENGVCNKEVGEGPYNCSMDCPLPPGGETNTLPPEREPASLPTSVPEKPSIAPEAPATQGYDATVTSIKGEKKSAVIPMTIGVTLILVAIVGLVYMKKKKTSE